MSKTRYFWTKTNHLNNQGCPICKESKGEKEIRNYLKNNNIVFESQKKFNNCRNKNPLPFDFYLPLLNICIEYDGIQHYKSNTFFGGEKGLKQRQINDKIKTQYCKDNDIRLLRIKYNQNNLKKLLSILC